MNGHTHKTACLFLIMLLASVSGQSQEVSLDSVHAKFKAYRDKVLQEKMYAHIDQTFHLTGETLWFKLYTVDGSFHKPIGVSKVAYVELLDRSGLSVLQAKIELENGSGFGSFFLPASLSTGKYNLRAYTNWMKNFPPEFYFQKVISIVNPFVVPEMMPSPSAKTYRIDFFPEGGNLVDGLQSKVAFKISDNSGRGSFCRGVILNQAGDTIASFAPQKFGLGNFVITPVTTEKYHAVLTEPSGIKRVHPFPDVHPAGFVMHLHDSGDFLEVNVRAKPANHQTVHLFVHARQIISAAQTQTLAKGETVFRLSKEELQDGISHLTLFDSNLQPACERLYFTYPQKTLDISIATNQKIISRRGKVTVSLQVKSGDQVSPANLSMSVYKIDSLLTGNATGINPYLWLTSDLTGSIESPDYYFSNPQTETREAMDNIMLTHGWRRFEWSHVLREPPRFTFLPEVREHIVTAIVSQGDKRLGRVFTYLGSPGRIIRAYGAWTNADGEAKFEIKDFYGPRRIILQTKADSGFTYQMKIVDPFSQQRTNVSLPLLVLSQNAEADLLSRSVAMQVQDIYYYEQTANDIVEPLVDSSAFYGNAENTYYLDDYTRFPIMEEVMREYVPPVFVRKRKDGFHFLVINGAQGGVLPGDPMVLLDGVPILDVDDVMRMDPLLIKKLEIVKRQYYLGPSVFSGIVSYTTYQGDLAGMALDARSISLDYDGLQLKRRFHQPVYTGDRASDRMPDQRHLLHWQPVISTDKDGRAQVEFYTSDVTGQYQVVVEGTDESGCAGSKAYTFSVIGSDDQ